MNESKIIKLVSYFTAIVLIGVIVWWHLYSPGQDFEILAPGADNRPAELARKADDVKIGEFFMRYNEDDNSTLAGQWNGFRGEGSANIVKTDDILNLNAPEFQVLWSVETGEGHASPVIRNGKVYFLDYDENLSSDALRCFSLEKGIELWRRWYRVPMKRNHGFSRTIPAIGNDFVITIGPNGHVMCCDPNTGDLKWSLDMQKEFKSEIPFWYTGQCPLVDGETLVLAPAGNEVLLTGLNCSTGQVEWTTPNTLNYKMSHSSVMKMALNGKPTYVYAGIGGICGVSAEKEDIGKPLWNTNKWQPSVIAPSPLQVTRNRIFMVAGYGAGGAMVQINGTAENWVATVLEEYKPSDGVASEQQTPIIYNNMIISVMPKDGGGLRNKLVCYSPDDLHTPLWSSAADDRFGLGPYLIINNHLFALKEDGELYMYEVGKQSLKFLRKQRIMDGVDAWGPMAYANGMLLLRDAHTVKCIKVS
ncbi:MAG: PQQ-binding-like beta-propeller repeat protein [Mangrovibacterium sp.]